VFEVAHLVLSAALGFRVGRFTSSGVLVVDGVLIVGAVGNVTSIPALFTSRGSARFEAHLRKSSPISFWTKKRRCG